MFTIKGIFKESIGVLLFASVLSLIAGLFLRFIEHKIIVIVPLIIILPALNDMIGDFGVIMISRFTTALYQKRVHGYWYHSGIVRHLFREVFPISILSAFYIAFLAFFIAYFKGSLFDIFILWKVIVITLLTCLSIVIFVFLLAIIGGLYVYKKKLDPDDVLIPITTSIADLASMFVFMMLVRILF